MRSYLFYLIPIADSIYDNFARQYRVSDLYYCGRPNLPELRVTDLSYELVKRLRSLLQGEKYSDPNVTFPIFKLRR
jgi:hypothetical protein